MSRVLYYFIKSFGSYKIENHKEHTYDAMLEIKAELFWD